MPPTLPGAEPLSSLFSLHRFGCKLCLLVTLLINGVSGVLMAFAPSHTWTVTSHLIQGLASKGGWLTEYVPSYAVCNCPCLAAGLTPLMPSDSQSTVCSKSRFPEPETFLLPSLVDHPANFFSICLLNTHARASGSSNSCGISGKLIKEHFLLLLIKLKISLGCSLTAHFCSKRGCSHEPNSPPPSCSCLCTKET